jgi:hypothetical protein
MAKSLQEPIQRNQAILSRHFKGVFSIENVKFDPCMVSQALRLWENFLLLRQKAPKITGFRAWQSSLETGVRAITLRKSATVSG